MGTEPDVQYNTLDTRLTDTKGRSGIKQSERICKPSCPQKKLPELGAGQYALNPCDLRKTLRLQRGASYQKTIHIVKSDKHSGIIRLDAAAI